MYAKSSFHVSVPDKLRVPGIILLIILQQFIFGISSATINRLSSFYGFEPDTVLWFSQIAGISSVGFIPFYYRLAGYFKKREFLFIIILAQMLISILCYSIHYAPVLLVGNFLIEGLKTMCTANVPECQKFPAKE